MGHGARIQRESSVKLESKNIRPPPLIISVFLSSHFQVSVISGGPSQRVSHAYHCHTNPLLHGKSEVEKVVFLARHCLHHPLSHTQKGSSSQPAPTRGTVECARTITGRWDGTRKDGAKSAKRKQIAAIILCLCRCHSTISQWWCCGTTTSATALISDKTRARVLLSFYFFSFLEFSFLTLIKPSFFPALHPVRVSEVGATLLLHLIRFGVAFVIVWCIESTKKQDKGEKHNQSVKKRKEKKKLPHQTEGKTVYKCYLDLVG